MALHPGASRTGLVPGSGGAGQPVAKKGSPGGRFRLLPSVIQVWGPDLRGVGVANGLALPAPSTSLPRCPMLGRVCGRWSTCCRCLKAVLESWWTWDLATAGL